MSGFATPADDAFHPVLHELAASSPQAAVQALSWTQTFVNAVKTAIGGVTVNWGAALTYLVPVVITTLPAALASPPASLTLIIPAILEVLKQHGTDIFNGAEETAVLDAAHEAAGKAFA